MKRFVCMLAVFLLSASLSACGSRTNQVRTPADMKLERGRDYKEVIEDFQDKGFTNIKTEPIEDLQFGWTFKNNQVETISVGGDTRYESGILVPADTEVIIRYHTYRRSVLPEDDQDQ